MNKYLFAAAIVAFAMLLTACKPDEPQVETHEVEVFVEASVTGAFTKAVSIQAFITDFDGAITMLSLNERFDGGKTSFERSFKTDVKTTDAKTASVAFTALVNPDYRSYKDEPAPWSGQCKVTVVLDGREIDAYEVSEWENHTGMTLVDGIIMNNWAASFVEQVDRKFGLNVYSIKINGGGVDIRVE